MSIYPRIEYEMTNEQLAEILEACKPATALMISGHAPSSQQENANNAWAKLGKKLGFDSTTVQPSASREDRFFSAIPSETEYQRMRRIEEEENEKRKSNIKRLETEIASLQEKLRKLLETA